MKQFNLVTGKIGEELSRKYLADKGYKIIEANYKTKYGEIDLICLDKKELVFVEVRTKKGSNFGSPEESLDRKKLRKIWLNSQAYLKISNWPRKSRIDAICIILSQNNQLKSLNYYQNIL